MHLPIKRTLERIPGGMMVVPLALGCLIGTLAPGTPKFFGSFTGALFTGALPIIAMVYSAAAQHATILVSASVAVTAVLVPFLTAFWADRTICAAPQEL